MDYKETLAVVKAQNPGLSHKECQKKASILYNAYKEGQADLAKTQAGKGSISAPGAAPSIKRPLGAIPTPELAEAEKAIRKGIIDVNKITSIGHDAIPDGRIVNHGKADNGVNTLVSYEDDNGNRLPVEGFFQIFF